MKIEEIIREKKGTILDVRTNEEFQGGHVSGSLNRSGQAYRYLSQLGIDCLNGGSWMDVNYYQSLTV